MEHPSDTEAGQENDVPPTRRGTRWNDVYVVRPEEDEVEIDRPLFYKRNFYHYCDAIVDCFNLRRAGMLFGVRGSNMCESGNSDFRRIVMVPKLSFADIPERMIRETTTRAARQEDTDKKSSRLTDKALEFTRMFASDEQRLVFVNTLTNYCLQKFMALSLRRAGIWRVKDHTTVLEGETYRDHAHGFPPPFLRFRLRRDEERDLDTVITEPHEQGIQSEYDVDIALREGTV